MDVTFVSPGLLYPSPVEFQSWGVESQIHGLASRLARNGHTVTVTGRFDWLGARGEYAEGQVLYLNIGTKCKGDYLVYQLPSIFAYSRQVSRSLSKSETDVLCLKDRFASLFPSRLSIPKTYTVHNPDGMSFYRSYARSLSKWNYLYFEFKRLSEDHVIRNSNSIVALTESMKGHLNESGVHNVSVIPNAVDHEVYTNKGDGGYILYAGRLSDVKGITYLVKAFARICRSTDVELMLVGSGPCESDIRREVASCGIGKRVRFVPAVSKIQLRPYLANCSLFVLPSLYETFATVVLEAMASAKCVVASNIPGPGEIISHGYDGLLFKRGDVDDLARCLEIALSDSNLRRKLGTNAAQTAREKYTFSRVAGDYVRLWKSILGE